MGIDREREGESPSEGVWVGCKVWGFKVYGFGSKERRDHATLFRDIKSS